MFISSECFATGPLMITIQINIVALTGDRQTYLTGDMKRLAWLVDQRTTVILYKRTNALSFTHHQIQYSLIQQDMASTGKRAKSL